MKSNKELQNNGKVSSEEAENKETLSIDEFFRQLEAKEKDLDISSELVIEIDEADVDEDGVPEFLKEEIFSSKRDIHRSIPPNDFTSNSPESFGLENKISNLQNQISKLESERVEIQELMRRRQIDFDGYKKRTERERGETFRNQLSNLATQMLPVLDNLNRALDSASSFSDEKLQDFQQFFEGIMLVGQQLNEVLEEMGVQPIAAVGESFDPHFHEAVATETTDDVPPYTITAELLRGYRIDDKVIRASMVKVSSPTKLTPADVS
ncbi:MAG TPA: nucleotide exchange factor GrpE [Pyrinomonadaceae bacterium]|nr:nucleotide exchange factor GrpE [Pyrinomonadaceae bacterium]